MCESLNIQRFVLVWMTVKSADRDLSLLDLLKRAGDPGAEEVS